MHTEGATGKSHVWNTHVNPGLIFCFPKFRRAFLEFTNLLKISFLIYRTLRPRTIFGFRSIPALANIKSSKTITPKARPGDHRITQLSASHKSAFIESGAQVLIWIPLPPTAANIKRSKNCTPRARLENPTRRNYARISRLYFLEIHFATGESGKVADGIILRKRKGILAW